MKSKNFYTFGCLILFIFLGFNLTSTPILSATTGNVSEYFNTTDNMDTSNSDVAGWGTGSISISALNPDYLDLIKVSTTTSSSYIVSENFMCYYINSLFSPFLLNRGLRLHAF